MEMDDLDEIFNTIDYGCLLDDAASPSLSFPWLHPSSGIDIDFSQTGSGGLEQECSEKEYPKKRGRAEACSKSGSKACKERLRREKMNESFLELSNTLVSGRAAKADKLAVLNDTIRVLNQLRVENDEFKEENTKLKEEIKSLKAEKNELREEKHTLKTEKEKMEQQLKATTISTPPSMVPRLPPYPSSPYHAGSNQMALYPSHGMVPMWHYLPQSTRDTSRDHELRPPAA